MKNALSTSKKFTRRAVLKGGATSAATAIGAAFIITSKARADTINMRLGSTTPIDDPHSYSVVRLAEELDARTGGRIKATMFPNSQLGSDEVMMNSIKAGTLDGDMPDLGTLTPAVSELEVFTLPFLFKDIPHALRALDGKLGEIIKPRIEEAFRCYVIGWGADGTRLMWNDQRPIRTPDDVVGLKMRVQPAKTHQDTYSALGALPTVVPFSELYSALQTGVIDGADVGLADLVALKLYQVTKYVSFTNHVGILNALIISKKFMNKLDLEDQEILREVGDVAARAQVERMLEFEANAVDFLKGKGLEFFEVESQAAFADKMAPVYESMKKRSPQGAELIEIARSVQ